MNISLVKAVGNLLGEKLHLEWNIIMDLQGISSVSLF